MSDTTIAELSSKGPLESDCQGPASAEQTVAVRVLNALLEAFEHAGVPRERLLHAAGVSLEEWNAPEARIPEADIRHMCELALDLSADPALGLHWAERLTVDTFVPLSYLVTHAPTLGQALETLTSFAGLMADEPVYRFVESAQRVTIRCLVRPTDSLRMQRFMAEMSVVGFMHVMRCFDAQWRPEHVSFEFPAPDYRNEYARVFEHTAQFDQPFTGMSFDRALLDKPSLHRDEGIYASLRELAQQRLGRLQKRAPYALLVRDHLVQDGRLARANMASVATALGLSVRSLRRRLATEGKPYTDIASEAFAIVTRRLLLDQASSIQEAAFALGFSSTTAFHRAFKRATGVTPQAFVEAQLGQRRRR